MPKPRIGAKTPPLDALSPADEELRKSCAIVKGHPCSMLTFSKPMVHPSVLPRRRMRRCAGFGRGTQCSSSAHSSNADAPADNIGLAHKEVHKADAAVDAVIGNRDAEVPAFPKRL